MEAETSETFCRPKSRLLNRAGPTQPTKQRWCAAYLAQERQGGRAVASECLQEEVEDLLAAIVGLRLTGWWIVRIMGMVGKEAHEIGEQILWHLEHHLQERRLRNATCRV